MYIHNNRMVFYNLCAMGYKHLEAFLLQDTDVIVWDIINECGLYRLRGHKDVITQALFVKDKNLLVTR